MKEHDLINGYYKRPLVLFQRFSAVNHSCFISSQPIFQSAPVEMSSTRAKKEHLPANHGAITEREKQWIGMK